MSWGLLTASDSQQSPQHSQGYRYPSGDHAEDCHGKSHKFLHSFVVFLLS
ncbi:hypothetical protein PS928_05633 [Pseudomonas fluorescens]|uniref:Uncharacterized protein n=1 Tax=Pseudomonas fluorescens TaxID=294 RepID=A0A5E7VM57_PSEFL|nr:hypothetical protein PS928_05633 [Pseudomonas fluorescens]